MVRHLLPAGLRGIVVAGLLSALMGSLAGVFNACSTLFTVDLYGKWKPRATQHQVVRTGRMATAVMVLIALAWIPVIRGAHGLYEYLQAVQGYLAPPIFVVFFFGVFFKRLNAKGCFAAMVVGFILGVFRMLVDTPVTMKLGGFEEGYTPGSLLWIINNINFQYFSVLITIVSAVVMVGGELPDATAGVREDPEPDLRHGHGGRPPPDAGKLGLARSAGLGRGLGVHPRGLPVFPRIGSRVGHGGQAACYTRAKNALLAGGMPTAAPAQRHVKDPTRVCSSPVSSRPAPACRPTAGFPGATISWR